MSQWSSAPTMWDIFEAALSRYDLDPGRYGTEYLNFMIYPDGARVVYENGDPIAFVSGDRVYLCTFSPGLADKVAAKHGVRVISTSIKLIMEMVKDADFRDRFRGADSVSDSSTVPRPIPPRPVHDGE